MSLFGFLNKKSNLVDVMSREHVLLDVRTKEEFDLGHVDNSINIPLHLLPSQLDRIVKMNKPIIAFCRSGMRSGQAKQILESKGVECHNGGSWNDVARMTIR